MGNYYPPLAVCGACGCVCVRVCVHELGGWVSGWVGWVRVPCALRTRAQKNVGEDERERVAASAVRSACASASAAVQRAASAWRHTSGALPCAAPPPGPQ